MPKYWMVSDRNVTAAGLGGKKSGLSYWVADAGPVDRLSSWKRVSLKEFRTLLVAAADAFPALPHGEHEKQSHIGFFVHGYNNAWDDAARHYEKVCKDLFSGTSSLGLCILYTWPSDGSVLGYYPDRADARLCALDFADVLSVLYDWLLEKQNDAVVADERAREGKPPTLVACKAKISIIAHSMGNYVTQRALATVWTRKNQPLLVTLVNQLVMVAADVDNDLFEPSGDDGRDGFAVSNLTYRITALYSGRDAVLGASAGLKHFGTRRLGRSGLAVRPPSGKDNVWDVDCSALIPPKVSGNQMHGAYFEHKKTVDLMREILRGLDRGVLAARGLLA